VPRRVILILIALIVAIGAVFLTQLALRGSSSRRTLAASQAPKVAPPTQVLVAKTELFAGDLVKPTDLAWQNWPDGALPATYEVSTRSRLQDFVGAVVTSHMVPGDPVTPARLVKPNDRSFMAAVLQPGDRAVTVNVTPASGQAGFLFPGDRVDLILTSTVQAGGANGASHHVSETILRNIRIVGLDQTFSDKRDDKKPIGVPRTATLEVTPKQAEIVSVASDLGVLSLILDSVAEPNSGVGAGPGVTKTWDTEATQIAAAGARDPGEKANAPPMWVVDVVRGGTTVETPFPIGSRTRGTPGR
jgi:pilus assembly protein CpaB